MALNWIFLLLNKINSIFILVLLVVLSCTKKTGKTSVQTPKTQATEISYTTQIKPFVLEKCSTAGCHVKNFPFGDFTTYSDLKVRVTNGKVEQLVFESKLMPPSTATQLTNEEYGQLKIWITNGGVEN